MSNVRLLMSAQLLFAVLSSSLIGGVLGALVGGWFTLRVKRNDYANEYYKIVLARRVKAYEEVERLVSLLKSTVLDADGRPYHILFSKDEYKQSAYDLLFDLAKQSLWLSDDLFEVTRQFNVLLYSHGGADTGCIEFGKTNYIQIAELRTKIEKAHLLDMLSLHEVPRFLKSKKPEDSYVSIEAKA